MLQKGHTKRKSQDIYRLGSFFFPHSRSVFHSNRLFLFQSENESGERDPCSKQEFSFPLLEQGKRIKTESEREGTKNDQIGGEAKRIMTLKELESKQEELILISGYANGRKGVITNPEIDEDIRKAHTDLIKSNPESKNDRYWLSMISLIVDLYSTNYETLYEEYRKLKDYADKLQTSDNLH